MAKASKDGRMATRTKVNTFKIDSKGLESLYGKRQMKSIKGTGFKVCDTEKAFTKAKTKPTQGNSNTTTLKGRERWSQWRMERKLLTQDNGFIV